MVSFASSFFFGQRSLDTWHFVLGGEDLTVELRIRFFFSVVEEKGREVG